MPYLVRVLLDCTCAGALMGRLLLCDQLDPHLLPDMRADRETHREALPGLCTPDHDWNPLSR
jgi:hypothetical protein